MNHTGGFVYHLRALVHQRFGWRAHAHSVSQFLDAWMSARKTPLEETLILIGPSGGYSLPAWFIGSFAQVVAYEPDPMARAIFQFRFRKSFTKPIRWMKSGYDFKSHPVEGRVLFCNLLGQIPLSRPAELRAQLDEVLKGRNWASYHDALSGEGIRIRVPSFEHAKVDPSTLQDWIEAGSRKEVQVTAHVAPDLFPADPKLRFFYWEWRITRSRAHLIEGVYSV